jgi:hypothetical protein
MAQDEESVFDVFDESGCFIHQVLIPVNPYIISQDSLYEIHEDEETGEVSIRRFKILNWGSLKPRP